MIDNDKMRNLEERMDKLEEELISCGVEKDTRINAIHSDMMNMHTDMGALKGTVEALTDEIRCAVQSLKQIATNTANMRELGQLYDKWKGFAWVMKSVGFWGAMLFAFITGVVLAVLKLGGV